MKKEKAERRIKEDKGKIWARKGKEMRARKKIDGTAETLEWE